VQVLGRLHEDPIRVRQLQASEKRQGTKSREADLRRCSGLWRISRVGDGDDVGLRSAHQAVAQAQRYVAEGYNVVVDLDLENFSTELITTF
jgi:hypothetical protein